MSLLHATWLPATKAGPTATNGRMAAGLLLWADTWRVATPVTPTLDGVPDHPLSLNQDDLGAWLEELDLWSEDSRPAAMRPLVAVGPALVAGSQVACSRLMA